MGGELANDGAPAGAAEREPDDSMRLRPTLGST
jgi:hypothetical protein